MTRTEHTIQISMSNEKKYFFLSEPATLSSKHFLSLQGCKFVHISKKISPLPVLNAAHQRP